MNYLIDDEAWNHFQRQTYRICSSDGTEVFATIRDFDEAKTFATDYCNSHPDIDAVAVISNLDKKDILFISTHNGFTNYDRPLYEQVHWDNGRLTIKSKDTFAHQIDAVRKNNKRRIENNPASYVKKSDGFDYADIRSRLTSRVGGDNMFVEDMLWKLILYVDDFFIDHGLDFGEITTPEQEAELVNIVIDRLKSYYNGNPHF